jgi:hypothetical protein
MELEAICSYCSPITVRGGSLQDERCCRHIVLQEAHQQKWNCQVYDCREWYSIERMDERAAIAIVRCVNELQA